jgi:hypothetical protein
MRYRTILTTTVNPCRRSDSTRTTSHPTSGADTTFSMASRVNATRTYSTISARSAASCASIPFASVAYSATWGGRPPSGARQGTSWLVRHAGNAGRAVPAGRSESRADRHRDRTADRGVDLGQRFPLGGELPFRRFGLSGLTGAFQAKSSRDEGVSHNRYGKRLCLPSASIVWWRRLHIIEWISKTTPSTGSAGGAPASLPSPNARTRRTAPGQRQSAWPRVCPLPSGRAGPHLPAVERRHST